LGINHARLLLKCRIGSQRITFERYKNKTQKAKSFGLSIDDNNMNMVMFVVACRVDASNECKAYVYCCTNKNSQKGENSKYLPF